MPKEKKRLSKNAKEALKKLNESKLLAAAKAAHAAGDEFKPSSTATPRASSGVKQRPDKKRG